MQLTPEIEEYVRDHIRAVHDKLQAGEPVYEKDLEFIPRVRTWVTMPKNLREKYKNVDDIYHESLEAKKRDISLEQWLDLLHVAEAMGEEKEWIGDKFTFPGAGKIKTKETSLTLADSAQLTKLPDGLSVIWGLNIQRCPGLTKLPEGLSVGKDLNIVHCTGLTELPKGLFVDSDLVLQRCTGLTRIPEDIKVGGAMYLIECTGLTELPEGLLTGWGLDLYGCTGLTELPKKVSVGGDLNLKNCTGLTELPIDLYVGGNLFLSPNLNERVKEQAEILRSKGNIEGGEVKYEK